MSEESKTVMVDFSKLSIAQRTEMLEVAIASLYSLVKKVEEEIEYIRQHGRLVTRAPAVERVKKGEN